MSKNDFNSFTKINSKKRLHECGLLCPITGDIQRHSGCGLK